jgi:hypothetical protein
MNINKLVRMANQIADNFDYGTDKEKAAAGVFDHLSRFWTPEMKQAIIEYRQRGESGLSAVADRAVDQLAGKAERSA